MFIKKAYSLFIIFFLAFFVVSCNFSKKTSSSEKPDFNHWYNDWQANNQYIFSESNNLPENRFLVIESGNLPINGILRSMQGPFEVVNFTFENNTYHPLPNGKELIWLTGYYVEVFDPVTGEKLSDDFLCHNNLNMLRPEYCPWTVKTQGSNTRLFTLTEGHTHLRMPEGFGIPIMSNQPLEVAFQVLNHNLKDLKKEVKQRVIIRYHLNSDLKKPLKALYQQSIFVTELKNGPEGFHNNPIIIKNTGVIENKPGTNELSCGIEKPLSGQYNPFEDDYGRKFSGHWKFFPGEKTWKTPCTKMIDIKNETMVHFISVHIHPFCEWVRLVDVTQNDSIVFFSKIKNFSNKIGLEQISTFSSVHGLKINPDHRYFLETHYNNTDTIVHTAMATMFLYCAE